MGCYRTKAKPVAFGQPSKPRCGAQCAVVRAGARRAGLWYDGGMSNAEPAAPQQRIIGRPFQPGQSGNPAGRPRGSRNRLADAFISDLADAWQTHGAQALARCALEEPSQFVRVYAGLLPRDVNLNLSIDPVEFAGRFRSALAMLGNEPTLPKPRRLLPNEPVIDHD